MRIPGFTAEKSLSPTSISHCSVAVYSEPGVQRVEPQLPPQLGCYFRCLGIIPSSDICAYACTRNPYIV